MFIKPVNLHADLIGITAGVMNFLKSVTIFVHYSKFRQSAIGRANYKYRAGKIKSNLISKRRFYFYHLFTSLIITINISQIGSNIKIFTVRRQTVRIVRNGEKLLSIITFQIISKKFIIS